MSHPHFCIKPHRAGHAAWLLTLLLSAVLLAGCHPDALPWRLTNVSGHLPDLDFHLVDDHGRAVTAQDYRGKIVLLYFGYTHCPDVCPLTLTQLHTVLQHLGADADDARVLFVSVDPARDTPTVLHAYVSAFDARAVGLSGTMEAIETLSKRYRATFVRGADRGDGLYEISHSSAIYIFDRDGKARLLATPDTAQDDLVHDLHLLLTRKTTP